MSDLSYEPTRRDFLAGTAALGAVSLLSTNLEAATGSEAIRPFRVDVPQAELDDLRRRIAATRWPEQETVADASQGVQLATMQKLARYWATDYDWRKVRGEAERPAAVHHRDRRARHPLHPRALEARERAAGHRHARLAGLDHRAAEDHRSADQSDGARRERSGRVRRRDSVAAGLRVLGQADRDRLGSDPHRARLDRADEAPRLHALRGAGRRLGRCRHGADGAARRRRNCSAFTPTCRRPFRPRSPRRSQPAARRRPASRPTRRHAYDQLDVLLQARPRLRARRWRTARRRSTGSRIRRSAWPPGCSTTTYAATSSSPASSTDSPKA